MNKIRVMVLAALTLVVTMMAVPVFAETSESSTAAKTVQLEREIAEMISRRELALQDMKKYCDELSRYVAQAEGLLSMKNDLDGAKSNLQMAYELIAKNEGGLKLALAEKRLGRKLMILKGILATEGKIMENLRGVTSEMGKALSNEENRIFEKVEKVFAS